MTAVPQFIYVLNPVDPAKAASQENWTPADHEMFDLHWEHLQRAAKERTLVLAGRAQDGIGPAIAIIDCPDEDSARAMMESDPFIARGFARGTLHPFRIAVSRSEI
jgi:uncharacterized protein YciI